ncbi:MAG: thioredoxin domain-containing protein [Bacteroidetes bacterium]|nr:thioredoxin domain-containing protein [Bacteroidota bacterium]
MQKFILVITTIVTLSFSDGYSQNRSIRFIEKPWQEIVAMARKENKMIFLDAYASWCGPCKWMAAHMFTNDTVADYFNSTFICASIDMEKGEGTGLRKKYGVRAYPSLLFIDAGESMVHEKVGAPQRVNDYIEMAKVAQDPEECLSSYIKKYNAGNNSPQFIEKYLYRLADAYIPVTNVMTTYFATQHETDLLSRQNWNIIYRFVSDCNDPLFDFLVKHQQEYAKRYTRDSVNNKVADIYLNSLRATWQSSSLKLADSAYRKMKEKVRTSGFAGAGKVIFTTDLQWFQMQGKDKEYLELATQDLDKYYSDDYAKLINAAATFLSIAKDNKYLEKAGEWAKKSISIKNVAYNNDIYASILFKLGKTKDAIRYEKEAIDIAKKMKEPSAQFEESLKKMQEPK